MSVREQVAQALEPFASADLVILFGSAARGTMRADSDLDLAIQTTSPSSELRVAIDRALEPVAGGRRVHVIDLNEAPSQLRFEIARDGIAVLERRPYAWADFRARAMIDWWDWAPYARMIHKAAADRARSHHGPA